MSGILRKILNSHKMLGKFLIVRKMSGIVGLFLCNFLSSVNFKEVNIVCNEYIKTNLLQ